METLEIILAKPNSIRFKQFVSGSLPTMDNRLSCEEVFTNTPTPIFDHIFFKDDVVLVQIKAGLTATVVLNQVFDTGITVTITSPTVTTYPTFKIYDYAITFSAVSGFYFDAKSTDGVGGATVSQYISEHVFVIDDDPEYLLVQWTNLDIDSNSFEFDYTTTLAKANVNYMRIRGQVLPYEPEGEETVYDNQDEVEIIKASYFRSLVFEPELIPRHISEILGIATRHDRFLVNSVSFKAKKLPEMEMQGAYVQFSAKLTQSLVLGINTHDINFDCDSITTNDVMNIIELAATGAVTGTAQEGYSINQILLRVQTGTVTIKIGNTVGGEEIMKEKTGLTSAMGMIPVNIIHMTDAGFSGNWTIYITISGGTIDVRIQTIIADP